MSTIINILPDLIANQIAAGEVVQRPESVIKELVENSLDAGANSIYISIRESGKSQIQIIDDGFGMSNLDLELSIKRHATSKVLTQDDLEAIKSFGFRGEALASISAVAKLEIKSFLNGSDHGWKLISEPNLPPKVEPNEIDKGTQITVNNLFYNVPARRKFLRANLSEFRYILDTVNKFLISNNDKRFIFYDDNNLIYDVKPESLLERIKKVIGKKISDSLLEVNFSKDNIKITGFIGQPSISKLSKSYQFFFLNKRSINNKSLSHSVTSAYGNLIEKTQYPIFILFIELDPKEIDINIHPQKHEVKFEDERLIYNIVKEAVNNTLVENNIIKEFTFKNKIDTTPFEKFEDDGVVRIMNRNTGEVIDNTKDERSYFGMKIERPEPKKIENVIFREKELSAFDLIFSNNNLFGNFNNKKNYQQIHNKYIICETEKGILIIDQHNAHERINYEKVLNVFDKGLSKSQKLLFPIIFNLNENEKSIVIEIMEELTKIGFEFAMQNDVITLFAIPLDVTGGMEEDEFKEILNQYYENDTIEISQKKEKFAASYSCKSAIKTGKVLSFEEMDNLYKELFKCKTPEVCPHGRPVIMEISLKELDLQFGRTPTH